MSINWNGDKCLAEIRKATVRGLHAASQDVVERIKREISTQGPPRSAPGQPPRVDTGELKDSYYYLIDESTLTATIASSSDHAIPLELGTSRMAARPHVRPVIAQVAAGNVFARIMSRFGF